MAMYWIKLQTTIYDDPRWIAINPGEAEATENIYIRLLVLAGISDAAGRLMIYAERPHTIATIATLMRRDKTIVGRAMDVLLGLGFIEHDGHEYAISNWERLQFKGDAKARERDRQRKRKFPSDSPSDSTSDSTSDSGREEDEEKDEEDDNNSVVVSGEQKAQRLLNLKWPHVASSAAFSAVAHALAINGEAYVLAQITYAQQRARDNPGKYLIDALAGDYANYRGKAELLAQVAEERQHREVEERQRRENEDEAARLWQMSEEGQATLISLGLIPDSATPELAAGGRQ